MKAAFLTRCFTEKKTLNTLCWAFEMCFRGALHICYNILCGRNSVRKAWCVMEHVVFSVLVLLCQPCLQACACHRACHGTRRVVWRSSQPRGTCGERSCDVTSLLAQPLREAEFWSYDGCNYQSEENSKVFIALECCQKLFIPRKMLWS